MFDGNRFFDWDNYDDNPLDTIGVNTIYTQKKATYAPSGKGEIVTDAFDTFMSNADRYAYPQVSEVAGYGAKVLVYGEGMVDVNPRPVPQIWDRKRVWRKPYVWENVK